MKLNTTKSGKPDFDNSSVSSGAPPIQVSFIIEYKKVYFYFLFNEIMLLFQVYGISNTTRDI